MTVFFIMLNSDFFDKELAFNKRIDKAKNHYKGK